MLQAAHNGLPESRQPMSAADTPLLVRRARDAQHRWATRSIKERLQVLRRLRHTIARDGLRLAELIGGNNRSIAQRLIGQVVPLADAIRFLEREAPRTLAPVRWGGRRRPAWLFGARLEIFREPLGLALIVAPSNYPLLLPGVQAVQALAAGNGVLLKPAPGCGDAIRAIRANAIEAGLEADLFGILPEDPSSVRQAMDAGIDKVFLTGSAETGKAALAQASARLLPAVMELSGCDAVFICPDADLHLAARAIAFALGFNGGATCIAPRRIFVPRPLEREFRNHLMPALDELPPARIEETALERLKATLDAARESGAIVVGGEQPDLHSIRPAVVLSPDPASALLQSDLMGPVTSIVPVADMDEALRLSGRCPYKLGATVFGSTSAARSLASRIDAGVVLINDTIVPHADPRLPFGGRRHSGFGVTRGAEGLLEMTRIKAVSARSGHFRPHYDAPRAGDDGLFANYLLAAHGDRRLTRAGAMLRTIGGLMKHAAGRSETMDPL